MTTEWRMNFWRRSAQMLAMFAVMDTCWPDDLARTNPRLHASITILVAFSVAFFFRKFPRGETETRT